MPTTPSGIYYPSSSDAPRVWEDMQALAESVETVVAAFSRPRYIKKATTETVAGSSTLQNDDDLVNIALDAGKTYRVEGMLAISCTGTGDFKHAWTFTGGATQLTARHQHGPELASTISSATLVNMTHSNATTAISHGLAAAGGAASIMVDFLVSCPTAGTMTLQWAQDSIGGTPGITSLSGASYVILTEIEA